MPYVICLGRRLGETKHWPNADPVNVLGAPRILGLRAHAVTDQLCLQMCWRCWFSVPLLNASEQIVEAGVSQLFAASRTVFIHKSSTVDQGRIVRSAIALGYAIDG